MKCPQCKKTLSVARTFTGPVRTLRDRRCPKCGAYHKTIEVFEVELDKLHREHEEALHQESREKYALKNELDEIKGAVSVIFKAAASGKKR